MSRILYIILALSILLSDIYGQDSRRAFEDVGIQITDISLERSDLNWTITNHSRRTLFVYYTYLNGPAYSVRDDSSKSVFETVPTTTVQGCPNDFKPATVLAIQPGGATRGVFHDPELGKGHRRNVSLAIGVGHDAESVISGIMHIRMSPKCTDPAAAIIKWQTVIESNPFPVNSNQ